MLDANLDVPGNAAVADEIVAWLVHMTLLDDLDLHVEEVSQCTVLYHLVRYASFFFIIFPKLAIRDTFITISMS